MVKSKHQDFAISFIMGTDASIKEKLDSLNATYDIKKNKYYLTKIPKSKLGQYEKIINEYLKPGFWNEYISDDTVFIFKTLDNKILRFTWNTNTENEILKLCNDYAKFDKTSVKEMLLGEEFYKNNSIEIKEFNIAENFKVNYHASVCINNNIYIDPLNIKGEPKNAKVILITHSHWDHLSVVDIKKVANDKTHFIAPQDCIDKLKSEGFELENQKNYWAVGGKSYENGDEIGYQIPNTNVWVQAFPSYNANKQFHPKENLWVGYILTIDKVRYVICGDSDFTPELSKIKADILFIPIGGTFTMSAKEAAECTNAIKPKLVVPIHYLLNKPDGTILGSKDDEKIFIDNLDKKIKYKIFF